MLGSWWNDKYASSYLEIQSIICIIICFNTCPMAVQPLGNGIWDAIIAPIPSGWSPCQATQSCFS